MTHRWGRTVLLLASAYAVSSALPNLIAAQTPASQAPLQILVSAAAKDGAPVTVDASALSASIDKQPAQIVSVRPTNDDKLLFAVMVDMSSSEAPKEAALKDAAIKTFQGLTNERSHGYLVLFNVQAYPSKRPLQPEEVQDELNRIRFHGGTALYDAIAQVSSGLLSRSQNPDTARRALIVLSDGDDNYSHILADKMEEAAERESLPIFSLSERRSDRSEKGSDMLESFARDTGGTAVLVNKMPDGVPRLVTAVQGQSMLSVASPLAGDGKLHSLSVKTSKKGISVAAPAHILMP
jgi:hypothetical protein